MRTIRHFILIVAVVGTTTTLRAQTPTLPMTSVVAASTDAAAAETDPRSVRLLVGRSTLVDVATPIARVSLTSADVADALVTAPTQLLINGKVPGTISMFVWDRAGAVRRYEVVVQRDLARLAEQVRQLFPGEAINVQSNGRSVVLSGTVSNKSVIDQAINVAAGYVDKKDEVVTLLQVREGTVSNQVLLRVRFAEVSRSAMTELGASLFTGPNGYKDFVGRTTTQQFGAPDFDSKGGGLVFSDYLNLFLFNTKHQLGTVIKALQNKGLFQSLAEPNLVAESGKEASFLAGGEIPIPVAQGSGSSVAISVQYKEFGVRLNFTPVVTGNRIHLKVRPEVSTLDFTNAVVLNGFSIPALSTRRTETELELENGQTFAIAGLMNNTMNSSLRKIPGIGDIPILGLLFKSKMAKKDQTELVVMITPEILPNNSTGVTSTLPRTPDRFLPPLTPKQSFEPPPPPFRPADPTRPGGDAEANPAPAAPKKIAAEPLKPIPATLDPQAAAAALSALTPMTRPVIHADAPPKASAPSTATAVPRASAAQTAPKTSAAQTPPDASAVQTAAKASAAPALTPEAKKALERAHQQEEAAKAAAGREALKQAELDRRARKEEAQRQAKLAKEQAKRDQKAAKRAAEEAKHQQEIADREARRQAEIDAKEAKRQAEIDEKEAKRQAEIEARQQKAVEEAQAKLKAAQAEYQAELAKKQQKPPR